MAAPLIAIAKNRAAICGTVPIPPTSDPTAAPRWYMSSIFWNTLASPAKCAAAILTPKPTAVWNNALPKAAVFICWNVWLYFIDFIAFESVDNCCGCICVTCGLFSSITVIVSVTFPIASINSLWAIGFPVVFWKYSTKLLELDCISANVTPLSAVGIERNSL